MTNALECANCGRHTHVYDLHWRPGPHGDRLICHRCCTDRDCPQNTRGPR